MFYQLWNFFCRDSASIWWADWAAFYLYPFGNNLKKRKKKQVSFNWNYSNSFITASTGKRDFQNSAFLFFCWYFLIQRTKSNTAISIASYKYLKTSCFSHVRYWFRIHSYFWKNLQKNLHEFATASAMSVDGRHSIEYSKSGLDLCRTVPFRSHTDLFPYTSLADTE